MIDTYRAAGELQQLRTLDEQSIGRIFDRYRQKLARMVLLRLDTRLVGKVDVEDVLQDAFVEASRRIQDYLERPSVPFYVWLRQIASQVLIDVHRRYLGAQMRDVCREVRFEPGVAHSAASALFIAHLADTLTSPSQCAVRKEAVAELRAALENLQEADREVLMLRHLEELGNNEVAQILGIDKCAASKRYLRALSRLRSAMTVDQHV